MDSLAQIECTSYILITVQIRTMPIGLPHCENHIELAIQLYLELVIQMTVVLNNIAIDLDPVTYRYIVITAPIFNVIALS